jgi:hypothetical protein
VDSLAGKLIVSSPSLLDPNFRRTVVLMTHHDLNPNGQACGDQNASDGVQLALRVTIVTRPEILV